MTGSGVRVLLTGGAGFIGSHVAEVLLGDPSVARLTVLDNCSTGSTENLASVARDARWSFMAADVRDPAAVHGACADADVVFHLACLGLRHGLHSPRENQRVNAEGALTVALAAAATGVARLVHVSSSEVYGTARSVPMGEDHPTSPTTVYGAAKLAGEAYVRAVAQTTGLATVVIRPFNTYGPRSHVDGDAGELIPRTIARVLAGRAPVVFGDGAQTRDFVYVDDCAEGIAALGFCDAAIGRCVNLGSGREVTVDDVCGTVTAAAGRAPQVSERYGDRPGDVRRLVADAHLAARLVQWRSTVDFEAGVASTVRWFRDQDPTTLAALANVPVRNWVPDGAR